MLMTLMWTLSPPMMVDCEKPGHTTFVGAPVARRGLPQQAEDFEIDRRARVAPAPVTGDNHRPALF